MVQRTAYIERVMDPELSMPACQKEDNSAMWILETLLDLSGKAEESSFFEDGCPTSQLMLLPHQRAQASPSTEAGGFGLSSVEAWRVSVSVGSMVSTILEVLADLSGITGEKVRRGLPDLDLVRRFWRSVRDLRDVHGFSEEAMATSCGKVGVTEPSDQDSRIPQGSRLLKCCPHMTPKP